ncbi:MAG TPA: ABC transporter substrate-binding protein, partial [Lacunisphaera sp.]|nr:ABC transporter substrate-binding protein [Lacunisphaera sp.]
MPTKHTKYHEILRGILSCLVAGFVGLSASCKKRETDVERGIREQILHRGLSADLSSLDPHLISGLFEINVVATLFEGLVGEHPETGAPVPAVAERWETSADGLKWTFHLRADARWSNGEPVTATDFVNSIQRALSSSLAADNAGMLFVLANAEPWHRGEFDDFSRVGAKAFGPQTLELTLAHPAPYLPTLLSHPIWYPIHRPTLEKAGGTMKRDSHWTSPETLVGNGPFTLKVNRRSEVLIVEKSPTDWDAA